MEVTEKFKVEKPSRNKYSSWVVLGEQLCFCRLPIDGEGGK